MWDTRLGTRLGVSQISGAVTSGMVPESSRARVMVFAVSGQRSVAGMV